MTWHDMTWHDMTWHDMTWHDMIWFYYAQNHGPKAELQSTIREKKEKTQYDQKQSYKYNNGQQRNRRSKTVKQASKGENKEVQLWEFAVDQLHIILDWTTSISIRASMGLGEFGIVPQLPTMYLASAWREQLTSLSVYSKLEGMSCPNFSPQNNNYFGTFSFFFLVPYCSLHTEEHI